MIFEPVGPTSVPFSLFPRECVDDYIPDNSAGDAISNTPALNVDQSTQRPNVPLPELTRTTVQHQTCPQGVTVRDALLLRCGHPLGIIPKKSPGEFRLIHHFSYPAGSSVNDGIPKELATVRCATIYDSIRLIQLLGKGCFLAKTDIKSAFRIIPVSPPRFSVARHGMAGKVLFWQMPSHGVLLVV